MCKTPDHKQRGLCLYINIHQSSESHSFEERLRFMAEWWGGGKEHISEKKSRTLISKDAGISSLIENTKSMRQEVSGPRYWFQPLSPRVRELYLLEEVSYPWRDALKITTYRCEGLL